MKTETKLVWPENRRFAFTIFDDPDGQSLEQSRIVYSFLADLGFRTTKGMWLVDPPESNSGGVTCAEPENLQWSQALQRQGFELGYHNGAPGNLDRAGVIASLDDFRRHFGTDPATMANHYNQDAMYWGPARFSTAARYLYLAATCGRTRNQHSGHLPSSPHFWGDVCQQRIRYCRNFVYNGIDTLASCPFQPYHDPQRPFVNYWYTSTDGTNCRQFTNAIREENQDLLERQGSACIMYTHFGHGFFDDGQLNPEFKRLMQRLAAKNGWFVPVAQLLDFLRERNGHHVISSAQRSSLERRWMAEKLFKGTT